MKCTKCGVELEKNVSFCCYCGCKIEKRKFCRECGTEILTGGKFCSKCGANVDLIDEFFANNDSDINNTKKGYTAQYSNTPKDDNFDYIIKKEHLKSERNKLSMASVIIIIAIILILIGIIGGSKVSYFVLY